MLTFRKPLCSTEECVFRSFSIFPKNFCLCFYLQFAYASFSAFRGHTFTLAYSCLILCNCNLSNDAFIFSVQTHRSLSLSVQKNTKKSFKYIRDIQRRRSVQETADVHRTHYAAFSHQHCVDSTRICGNAIFFISPRHAVRCMYMKNERAKNAFARRIRGGFRVLLFITLLLLRGILYRGFLGEYGGVFMEFYSAGMLIST